MSWFKVCDTVAFHRKTLAAGNGAMGLWLRAGAWSMSTLTDGHVPADLVRQLGTAHQAKRLVAAGLWHPAAEVEDCKECADSDGADGLKEQRAAGHEPTGFLFHEFTIEGRQRTRGRIQDARAVDALRKRSAIAPRSLRSRGGLRVVNEDDYAPEPD